MVNKTKILFLTTQPPDEIRAEWPYQNWSIPEKMKERGAIVSIKSWRDETLDSRYLAAYDVITFLWCNDYHLHPLEFPDFIKKMLQPAQLLSPAMRIVNDSSVILWNTDKAFYLGDLQDAGFLVPKTEYVKQCKSFSTVEDLARHVSELAETITDGPVVLKPSISASSMQTHLIKNPKDMTDSALEFLEGVRQSGIGGSLIVQEFEAAISRGEYSLVFICGKHTHTMLKTPVKGEFRCQEEFGGGVDELTMGKVPEQAYKIAVKVMDFLYSKVGTVTYCRIDGVIRENGDFVLMEVEAIEPEIWLETCKNQSIREALCSSLLGHDIQR
jgi:glutathione synthase/RimK-type ligase-like ATP-grasp enzyme